MFLDVVLDRKLDFYQQTEAITWLEAMNDSDDEACELEGDVFAVAVEQAMREDDGKDTELWPEMNADVFATSVAGAQRILLAKVNVIKPDGNVALEVVGLDTCCSDSLFSPTHALATDDSEAKATAFGGTATLGPQAEFKLRRADGSTYRVCGRNATDAGHLPKGVVALIGLNDCRAMGVDFNWHAYFAPKTGVPRLHISAGSASSPRSVTEAGGGAEAVASEMAAEVYLSELQVREFLQRKGDSLFSGAKQGLDSIKINPDLSDRERAILRGIVSDRLGALGNAVDLPPEMVGGRHKVQLKPGVKPVQMPLPRYSPAKLEFIRKWSRNELARGAWEWAGESEWASQLHLAHKDGPRGFERTQFEIRPCGNYVRLNECIEKMAPNTPRLSDDLERVADFTIWLEAWMKNPAITLPW